MLYRVLVAVACAAILSSQAIAGPFEEGITAYKAANYTTALSLWQPLADRGDARAQNNLGVLYEEGRGVAMDYEKAADWYRKAAAQGHAGARKNLADLGARGLVATTNSTPPASTVPDLVAGVGDIVLRVETSEPLPNIFGGADIFGRRRPTGSDILQFAGLRGDKVVFVRTSVSVQSNATTMTESPRYVPLNQFSTFSGNVGSTQIFGTGTTTGGVWAPPRGSQSTATQLPAIEIEVDWQKDPMIVMSGKRLVVRSVTATTLSYSVAD